MSTGENVRRCLVCDEPPHERDAEFWRRGTNGLVQVPFHEYDPGDRRSGVDRRGLVRRMDDRIAVIRKAVGHE